MDWNKLNPEQREAVTATEGYIRVIAGAGSGKTRALSSRFARLGNELGIPPGNIVFVTFTNKAAAEMRQRIHALTGDNDSGYVNTFHGFCVSILQEDAHAVGYPKSFLVLDNGDIDEMLRLIYEERGLTLRDMTFSAARDMIEVQKFFKRPTYYLDLIHSTPEQLREAYLNATEPRDVIFLGYLYQEKKCFGLDYNDLILFSLYIFEEHPEIRLKWQQRLEYIMIDEFQDIDELQVRLMEVLSGYHRNLFVVGDPDQTVYSWRGADPRYLMNFDQSHPGTRTIFLLQNYRSTPQILAVANCLIARNRSRIPKDLIPTLPDGESVLCHHADDAEGEAEWLALQLHALRDRGVPYRDMAVLYRAHYVTRSLEQVFRQRKLPYVLYSGVQFYDRAEIKDALSYLRMIVLRDDLSFRRIVNVPRRNLGRSRMRFLQDWADSHGCSLYDALKDTLGDGVFRGTGAAAFVRLVESFSQSWRELSVSELLNRVLDAAGYEELLRTEGSQERLDNLAELKQAAREFELSCGEEAGAEQFLAYAALFSGRDGDGDADRVKLMTVHAAKGLEFPYVFLCGMNEGIFPNRRARTLAAMEEERRLCYVAVTRAQKRLFLSEAEGRNLDGSPRYPSRFLLDVDPELLEFTHPPREGLIREAREALSRRESALEQTAERPVFAPGQRIRHAVFGTGTVLETDREKGFHLVRFDGLTTPRQISFRARLEAE